MPRYALKKEGEVVSEKEDDEVEGTAEGMKSLLEQAMVEAWGKPEAMAMKRKLSKVAKTHWKPQIEEALKTTGYAKELEARAREIKYNEKVKKVWE